MCSVYNISVGLKRVYMRGMYMRQESDDLRFFPDLNMFSLIFSRNSDKHTKRKKKKKKKTTRFLAKSLLSLICL